MQKVESSVSDSTITTPRRGILIIVREDSGHTEGIHSTFCVACFFRCDQ